MNVASLSLIDRLEIVLKKAADLLPAEIGNQLRAMITFKNLAIMAGVIAAWAVSHFFGVGFIADAILLTVGVIALGGVAFTAAIHLYDFAMLTYNATSEKDLDAAAEHLAQAITLIGVGAVMAILLKKKPGDTFKQNFGKPLPSYGIYNNAIPPLPSRVKLYKPTIRFTNKSAVFIGGTTPVGNIIVGRNIGQLAARDAKIKMLETIYHERVHQFLTPKYYVLRNLRTYLKLSSYNRSYLLRFLEEMLAETIARMRVHGMTNEHIIAGLRYPIDAYQITFSLLRHEATGVLLGPVTVFGTVYNVFYGVRTYDK